MREGGWGLGIYIANLGPSICPPQPIDVLQLRRDWPEGLKVDHFLVSAVHFGVDGISWFVRCLCRMEPFDANLDDAFVM